MLLLEDNPGDARLIREMLAEAGPLRFEASHASRLGDALGCLQSNSFDVVLSDLSLPDAEGLEAIRKLQDHAPQLPVVVLTGQDQQDLALEAVRHGAQDYLIKGELDGKLLTRAIGYAIERSRIQAALSRARDELAQAVDERTAELQTANEALMAEVSERRRLEEAQRTLNESLERQVAARTAELAETNAQLLHGIEKHRQMEGQLLKRNRELLSLQTAITATAASLDQQFVLGTVTWEMTNLLEVDGCTIFEWQPQTDSLSVLAQHPEPVGWQDEPATEIVNLANHRLRQVVLAERSAQQMTISQQEIDPQEWARMREDGVRALLFIPVAFQDRVVGLLEMRSFQDERVFTDHEISLAHLLANQAASAIENARLYEQAQHEIARRREAEGKIKASLQEKEVLLKEIHHRVKNNLQVVSSLLYLQSEIITDPAALAMLQDSQNRVRSMAMVHERLYQARDLSRIDFSDYVRDLANQLLSSYRTGASYIELEIEGDKVALDVDTAVPCGLIINELVSNSLKHAFPNRAATIIGVQEPAGGQNRDAATDPRVSEPGKIHLGLHLDAEGELQILVSDNGVGIPADFDIDNTESLGLLLVNSLVRQLKGTLELNSATGTEFKIVFRLPASKEHELPAYE